MYHGFKTSLEQALTIVEYNTFPPLYIHIVWCLICLKANVVAAFCGHLSKEMHLKGKQILCAIKLLVLINLFNFIMFIVTTFIICRVSKKNHKMR